MICVWLTKDGGDEIIINCLIDFVHGSNFALYTLPTRYYYHSSYYISTLKLYFNVIYNDYFVINILTDGYASKKTVSSDASAISFFAMFFVSVASKNRKNIIINL